jgi:hypothetical protein
MIKKLLFTALVAFGLYTEIANANIVYLVGEKFYPAKITEFTHELVVFKGPDVFGQIQLKDEYVCAQTACWANFDGWITILDVRLLVQDVYPGFSGINDASLRADGVFSAWFADQNGKYFGDFWMNKPVPIPGILMLFALGFTLLFNQRKRR